MNEMLLVVELAGRRAALPAGAVDCVVELEHLVPVPLAPDHVAGLTVLRSRPMTVIDCNASLGFRREPAAAADKRAVVIEQEGHLYGLLVDLADDIVRASSESTNFGADPGPGWRRAASGMIETEAGPLPMLVPAAVIAGNDASAEG